ncbi:hypothetical protein GBA52_000857 [Prunus armeniaca]|nr:hypothetical protein GBA52_000857 [Prunus armeniaca]
MDNNNQPLSLLTPHFHFFLGFAFFSPKVLRPSTKKNLLFTKILSLVFTAKTQMPLTALSTQHDPKSSSEARSS